MARTPPGLRSLAERTIRCTNKTINSFTIQQPEQRFAWIKGTAAHPDYEFTMLWH
jgi:hypothetical protein